MDLSSLLLPSAVFLLSTAVCSALFLFFFFFFKQDQPSKATANSAVLKGHPIIGNFLHLVRNGPRMVEWVAELTAASPTGTVTVAPLVFTANPSNVEHLTKSHFENYSKCDTITTSLHDFLGHGILNVDGEQWRLQRKTASFEFNTRAIRAFVLDTVHREAAGRLLPLLAGASQSGDVLNLQDVLERFAFDSICSLVFDVDAKCLGGGNDDGERFYQAFGEASILTSHRWAYPFEWMWKLMRWLNAGSERRLRDSMATVHESVDRWVQSRQRDRGGGGGDFLSRFVDGGYSEEFIRDILISFVLAGRDTTPTALTWFFWIMSSRPDVVEKILKEFRSIRSRRDGDGGEAFTLEELREMHYLHAALSESMRLHPPVALLPRDCLEDDVLPDGTRVRKGWRLMYSTHAMGRAESIWGEDCLEFRPERWMEEGVFRPRDPFRYPVFHAGPRVCLGKELAYIQMKAVAASIMEGFEVEITEKRGQHQQVFNLKMAGGLPVRVRERKRSV